MCGRCLDLNAGTRDDRHSMHKFTSHSLDVLHLTVRIASFSRSLVDDRKGDRVRPILPILYACTKRSPRKFVSIARIVNSCFTPILPLRAERLAAWTVTGESYVAKTELAHSAGFLYLDGPAGSPARWIASSIFNKAPKGPGGFVECRYKVNFDDSRVKRRASRGKRNQHHGTSGARGAMRREEENDAGGRRSILSSFHCKCQAQDLRHRTSESSDSALAVHLSCNIDCGGRGITIDPSRIFPRLHPFILSLLPSFTSAVTLSIYTVTLQPLRLFPSLSNIAWGEDIFRVYNLFIEETTSSQDGLRIRWV